ncbi:DNA-binding NarL/FixJ family response regulator [Chitinophaga skermanii]|uniref:DNA-binding NarL/FixJ family response regulator n=1 Tax=Chitinophaga skermanii TaxID=331697 RepID=A0A327QK31_9BACT|nr:response regulator transcription factor [Chitinophaga skermanii]RAJ04235.1 DNA-binding NarL/FixJ family response regulator [Chitinophaga skermanii]
MAIRIALVDDHTLFRQSLAHLLQLQQGFKIAMEASSGIDFLAQLAQCSELPDITLIDIDMPGMNGIELNEKLHDLYPTIRVIVLSIYTQERIIAKMIMAGASTYLFKNCEQEELIQAVHAVYKTGFYVNKAVFAAMQNVKHNTSPNVKLTNIPVHLTNRETEILRLICQEHSNPEIAEMLFLSVRTVEGHRNSLLLKTGCKNTAGLVLFAIRFSIFVA